MIGIWRKHLWCFLFCCYRQSTTFWKSDGGRSGDRLRWYPAHISRLVRHILSKFAKSRTFSARQVQRARIILLAADGLNNMQISTQVGLGQDSVSKWRGRFLKNPPFYRRLLKKTVPIWKKPSPPSLMTAHVLDSRHTTRMNRLSKSLRLPAAIRKSSDMRPATGASICLPIQW